MILKFYFKTKSGEWSLPDEEVKCLFDRMEAEGMTFRAYPARTAFGLIKDVFLSYNRTAEQFNNAVNTWRLIGSTAFQNTFIFAEGESFPYVEVSYYIIHPDVSGEGYITYYCVPCEAEYCW